MPNENELTEMKIKLFNELEKLDLIVNSQL